MLEKNSYITDQIQEERQVSFHVSYKGVKAKFFIFIKKRHHDLIKTWSFCYCVRFNKMSQTFVY